MRFPMDRPVKVVMLGAGGTGGYVAPYLFRLLHMLDRPARFIICDGDLVEAKNLDRQNFVEADLGENKARVLSERYSAVLGMETEYVPNFIETLPELMTLIEPGEWETDGYPRRKVREMVLLLGCVDNNRTRQLCHEAFKKSLDLIYIDSGNGSYTGQVVCGVRKNGRTVRKPIGGVHPEMLKITDRFPSEVSCAEAAQADPQSIVANVTAATATELQELDKKARDTFDAFKEEDLRKWAEDAVELERRCAEQSETGSQAAESLRSEIQNLTAELEYGNLTQAEYDRLRECREQCRELESKLSALNEVASAQTPDFDREIREAQEGIGEIKRTMTNVISYVSKRAELTFSQLKMNRVEISLYDVVKSTGEVKDTFKFTYSGRRYDRLSLSEKIRAGMEVSELMKRLTGRNYPVFVDNMESVDDLANVRPTGQIIMAKCVSNAPLQVRPIKPIVFAEQRAA